MATKICPNCNKLFTYMENNGDYIHPCGDFPLSATTGNEDILNTSTSFTEPDGTSGTNLPGDIKFAGLTGRNWGTRGYLETGEKVEKLTTRGNPVSRYRTRKKFTYIENP